MVYDIDMNIDNLTDAILKIQSDAQLFHTIAFIAKQYGMSIELFDDIWRIKTLSNNKTYLGTDFNKIIFAIIDKENNE